MIRRTRAEGREGDLSRHGECHLHLLDECYLVGPGECYLGQLGSTSVDLMSVTSVVLVSVTSVVSVSVTSVVCVSVSSTVRETSTMVCLVPRTHKVIVSVCLPLTISPHPVSIVSACSLQPWW